jgi:hypothetical protein
MAIEWTMMLVFLVVIRFGVLVLVLVIVVRSWNGFGRNRLRKVRKGRFVFCAEGDIALW